MTLVVNLYGGPGTGKSTTAAGVFAKLKQDQINCELATEFAKDLTWEERHTALGFQPYVIGKQMYKVHRLMDKVDVIVTDSPILLTEIYQKDMPESWNRFVLDIHNSWNTLNFFLVRSGRTYNPKGRNQTLTEAMAIDAQIREVLYKRDIIHYEAEMKPGDKTQRDIADVVKAYLLWRQ